MNELQIFNNSKFGQVRTVEINGKIHFVAIDVTKSLGYKNPNDAVVRHCKGYVKYAVPTNGGTQEMNIIPEGDIYRLAASSELPGADEFESWIFDEILPSIRKHGMYAKDELLDNPDLMIEVLQELKREREEKKLLQTENKLLAGQTLEWTSRKILEAIVKAYGASIHISDVNGFQEAWRDFKKELLYNYSININLRISKAMESSGRKTKPKTMDMIHDDELSKCISTAVALCKSHDVDISEIIGKYRN
jgi:prophage antirepressor-like protein